VHIYIFIPFLFRFRRRCFLKFCAFRLFLSNAVYKPISLLEQHDCKYCNAKDHRQCKSHVVPSIIEKISSGAELISEQCLLGLCCYCTLAILHKKTAYLLFTVTVFSDFRVSSEDSIFATFDVIADGLLNICGLLDTQLKALESSAKSSSIGTKAA
jgi:hypothetical protein